MSVKPGNFYNESLAALDFIRLDGTSTTTATIPFAFGVKLRDGTAALPSWSFTTETNTGMFYPTTATMGFTILGTERVRMGTTYFSALADNSMDLGFSGSFRWKDIYWGGNLIATDNVSSGTTPETAWIDMASTNALASGTNFSLIQLLAGKDQTAWAAENGLYVNVTGDYVLGVHVNLDSASTNGLGYVAGVHNSGGRGLLMDVDHASAYGAQIYQNVTGSNALWEYRLNEDPINGLSGTTFTGNVIDILNTQVSVWKVAYNGALTAQGSDTRFFTLNAVPTTASVGAIASIKLNAVGSGYLNGETLTITGGGANATFTVTVQSTVVVAITFVASGSGYSTATGVATTGGSGSGLTVDIIAIRQDFTVDTTQRGTSIGIGGSPSTTAALAITENSNSRIMELTRNASSVIGQLKTIAATETWTQNQGFPSPGAIILHFAINDNRVTTTTGSGDLVSPVYVTVVRPSAGTASSTKTAPALNLITANFAESSSMTYSCTSTIGSGYLTGHFTSGVSHTASSLNFTWSGTGTFTHTNRWADANLTINPTISGGGTYSLNNYMFTSRGTGTTSGNTNSVGFYHSMTGFDINWGYINETTTSNNMFGGDNVKNYRGTGSGSFSSKTLAPDVYDTYTGTTWKRQHEIVAPGANDYWNPDFSDVDHDVGGDTDLMFHLDAGGATSFIEQQVANSTTFLQFRQLDGTAFATFDSSTPSVTLEAGTFITQSLDVLSRIGGTWTSSVVSSSNSNDRLVVTKVSTATGNKRAALVLTEHNAQSSHAGGVMSLNAYTVILGSNAYTSSTFGGGLRGGRYVSSHEGTGLITQASGLSAIIQSTSTGDFTDMNVFHAESFDLASGSVADTASSFRVRGGTVTGTITTRYGLRVDDLLSAGTTNYGVFITEQTGPTNPYELWINGAGGAFFRASTQQIYSSAASTLDIDSNTTINFRIGGAVKAKIVGTQTWSITNGTTDRTYDANATTVDELADAFYTLIEDLKAGNFPA